MDITIPHRFIPRPYQLDMYRAMDKLWEDWDYEKKRAVLIWHRRCWKDKACFNYMVKKAIERKWLYFYIFPTYANGKKALRDNIDIQWFSMRNHIPDVLKVNENWQEMKIELKNWSIIQVVGTDGNNVDRLRGTNPTWCIFSEYAFQNPRAWDIIRPILAINGWWSIFNSTPNGKNHWYDMYEMARKNNNWYVSLLTADDTTDNNWDKIVTKKILDEELQSGMSEDMYLQEYFCSFEASIQGAYYSKEMKRVREDQRVTRVKFDPNLPVYTFWDLWMSDSTSIIFLQVIGKELRCIDYYENSWQWLSHYCAYLETKPYRYHTHYLPHDVEVKELWTGKSRRTFLEEQGMNNIWVIKAPKKKADAIEASRRTIPSCYFDEDNCSQLVRCLTDYHREYDESRKVYRDRPNHDWASHGADAFSYLSMWWQDKQNQSTAETYQPDYWNHL